MLVDSTKNWSDGHWTGGYVLIVEGPGTGEVRKIESNGATWISLITTEPFTTKPTEQSRYVVVQSSQVHSIDDALFPALTCPRGILSNSDYWVYQSDCAVDIEWIKLNLINGLGLSYNDYIEIPAMFYDAYTSSGWQTAAYLPGMVNLLVVGNRCIIPKPFGPLSSGTDIFDDYVESELNAIGLTVNFVDNWDTYHIGFGEIHCGTNVKRTLPVTNWWK
jgi:hypothetical protein